jgi:hypothetical protein
MTERARKHLVMQGFAAFSLFLARRQQVCLSSLGVQG